MKVKNATHWLTSDLRRIAARVVREELPRERFGDRAKSYTVYVGYNRSGKLSDGSCSGHAHYNSNYCHVNVPSGCVDPVDFAYVVGHEVGHSKGLRHGHMAPHHEHRTNYALAHYKWAKWISIEKRQTKVKARKSYDVKRLHAERMVRLSTTRAKRAATLLKKWQQKLRYYSAQQLKAACEKVPR